MKVWITKYALTEGIFAVEGVHETEYSSRMFVEKINGHSGRHFFRQDWHTNHSDAIDRACEMRDDKIKSLEKQLKKLCEMEFDYYTNPKD